MAERDFGREKMERYRKQLRSEGRVSEVRPGWGHEGNGTADSLRAPP
jgi:hypothetical protein